MSGLSNTEPLLWHNVGATKSIDSFQNIVSKCQRFTALFVK